MRYNGPSIVIGSILLSLMLSPFPKTAAADLVLGPVEYVQTDSSLITVLGYSIPSFTFWDGDSLKDLVTGEGATSALPGKVRVYLNVGTNTQPRFSGFFYAQSEGSDLVGLSGG